MRTFRFGVVFRVLSISALTCGALLAVTVPAFAAVPVTNFTGYGTLSGSQTIGAGEQVYFTDTSTNSPTSWSWTFGDGGTSTERNPTHAYAVAGTFTVTHTATNPSGSNTNTKTNYITVVVSMSHTVNLALTPLSQTIAGPPASPTFTVTIGVTPSTGQAVAAIDTFVSFNPAVLQVDSVVSALGNLLTTELQNTFDNDNGLVTYCAGKLPDPFPTASFNLAVITMHAIASGSGTPEQVSFVTDAEAYQVTMAVIPGLSGLADITGSLTGATVTVVPPPEANFTAAGAVSGTTAVVAGETVNFTDTSTGHPASWAWNFGDDTTSAVQNPSHAYSLSGGKTVSLTVTGFGSSDTETKTNYIMVTPGPLHHIAVSPANPAVQLGVNQPFNAATFDQYGNPRTGDPIAWSVTDATVGSVNPSTGVLTAGTALGAYTNVVVATSGAVTGTASVTLVPGPLYSITITPPQATVIASQQQTFSAQGYDRYGNVRTGDTFVWSVNDVAAGTIDASSGVFTAGTAPGTYANVVQAASGSVTASASVDVIGVTVDGTVTLQGGLRPASGRVVSLTVKLFAPGANVISAVPLATHTPNTVDSGTNLVTFRVDGVLPATYDITVSGPHTLQNVKRNVVVAAPATSISFGTLLEGNANDDTIINALDFSIMATAYMKSAGQSGFSAGADFDMSGAVNALDFSLLAANYMKTSPLTI